MVTRLPLEYLPDSVHEYRSRAGTGFAGRDLTGDEGGTENSQGDDAITAARVSGQGAGFWCPPVTADRRLDRRALGA